MWGGGEEGRRGGREEDEGRKLWGEEGRGEAVEGQGKRGGVEITSGVQVLFWGLVL